MTWIVRLTDQGCEYGPFTDRQTADGFAAFLTAEVDPAEVLPDGPNPIGLMDPVRELLAWRDLIADPSHRPTGETTALGAVRHAAGHCINLTGALARWLASDAEPPAYLDRVLAHTGDLIADARTLHACEAADLAGFTQIRTIGDPS